MSNYEVIKLDQKLLFRVWQDTNNLNPNNWVYAFYLYSQMLECMGGFASVEAATAAGKKDLLKRLTNIRQSLIFQVAENNEMLAVVDPERYNAAKLKDTIAEWKKSFPAEVIEDRLSNTSISTLLIGFLVGRGYSVEEAIELDNTLSLE